MPSDVGTPSNLRVLTEYPSNRMGSNWSGSWRLLSKIYGELFRSVPCDGFSIETISEQELMNRVVPSRRCSRREREVMSSQDKNKSASICQRWEQDVMSFLFEGSRSPWKFPRHQGGGAFGALSSKGWHAAPNPACKHLSWRHQPCHMVPLWSEKWTRALPADLA